MEGIKIMEKLTIFLDIDGCLVYHHNPFDEVVSGKVKPEAIPGSAAKVMQWHAEGHKIILTTGRPECMRESTISMLKAIGIIYDQLVMGCGPNPRVIVNDSDPDKPNLLKGIVKLVPRDVGIGDLEIFTTDLRKNIA